MGHNTFDHDLAQLRSLRAIVRDDEDVSGLVRRGWVTLVTSDRISGGKFWKLTAQGKRLLASERADSRESA